MGNDFIDFAFFFIGETEEVKIQEGFVEIEETKNGVLTIHGRDGLDTNVEKVRGAIAMDFALHVTGLGGV